MLLITLLLASTASATCTHGLSMFKRAEGETVEVNTFGYGPLNGPLNWASLAAENEACKAGGAQSPINLGIWRNTSFFDTQSLTLGRCLRLSRCRKADPRYSRGRGSRVREFRDDN